MGIDTGPFQDITAIEGGIFGKIFQVAGVANRALYLPGIPTCAFFSLVTTVPPQTPDPFAGSYTTVTMQVFVGEFFKDSASNPFAPELSESPLVPSGLYNKKLTHVDSDQSFVAATDIGPKGCEQLASPTDKSANFQSVSGTTYSPSGLFAPTEWVTFRGINIGTEFELWAIVTCGQNPSSWPSAPSPTARFWDVGAPDDKITFTDVE